MPLPDAVVDYYGQVQRIQLTALAAAQTAWARMGVDFDASWATIGPQLIALLSAAQGASARSGAAYIPAALAQQGVAVDPEGEVATQPLADVASDGRGLDGLLYGAVTTAKAKVGTGADVATALGSGNAWLAMAMRTQIVDASRAAASVAIAARPRVGWTRLVNPPCCGRCAILAGRFYRWSSGFQRHENCDCQNIPCSENTANDVRTDRSRLFNEGHVTGLSKADAKAIGDGANPSQVVNARRGMRTAQVYGRDIKVTSEGTTRRGTAYRALRDNRSSGGSSDVKLPGARYRSIAAPRLMPSSIYQIATDRADALRLLRLNGYVTN